MSADAETFEAHRPELVALAYRMLGDVGRAEDVVQEAWLRWSGRAEGVDAPKAFLVKTVANLCLNELDSARARREESRGDRLPEPIDLGESGLGRVEAIDRISMAFLVVLQRLTPAERAALLLHDVFDFSHGEIGALLDRARQRAGSSSPERGRTSRASGEFSWRHARSTARRSPRSPRPRGRATWSSSRDCSPTTQRSSWTAALADAVSVVSARSAGPWSVRARSSRFWPPSSVRARSRARAAPACSTASRRSSTASTQAPLCAIRLGRGREWLALARATG